MMMSLALIAAISMSAQTVNESKTFDNFYVGIGGGVSAKTTHTAVFNNLNWTFGARLGRNITPVVGYQFQGDFYLDNAPERNTGTTFRGMDLSALGTINFSNWFCGYPGTPRFFEVVGLAGMGWGHVFGNVYGPRVNTRNDLTSKVAIDFDFNLGKARAWQLYVEPALNYNLTQKQGGDVMYNANHSLMALTAGVVYKFGNSNGTHNFTIAQLRDQSEIDNLNSKINELRNAVDSKDNELNAKNAQVNDLESQLAAAKNVKPVVKSTVTNLQPTVIFRQGKSVVDPGQMASVAMIAKYMKNHKDAKILIKGYASPEGSKEINDKLSCARAESVKDALVTKYGIAADRLSTKGMGATDELFDEVDFNRVAMFNDESK